MMKIPNQGENSDIEILYVTNSHDDRRIALTLGRRLIKDGYDITEVVVYERNPVNGKFEILKIRDFEHHDACYTFQFNRKNSDELLFATYHEIFLYNFLDESSDKTTFYTFEHELEDMPKFACFSMDQTKLMIASDSDALYIDVENYREIDLTDNEGIESIQNCTCDEEHFYLVANKKEGLLGYFVLRLDIHKPGSIDYLIQWNNKLDIGNVNLDVFDEKGVRFLVVSFKSIAINTFNVVVINCETHFIRYWHESYQLWESPVTGFCLKTHEFLILSKLGVNVLVLGEKENHEVTDVEGQKRLIHALGSCNYLKVEPSNMIYFSCQFYEDRQIWIQEQYETIDGETRFEDIYKIKIHESTLRELLLINSIYSCGTQNDISLLV
jgi:hypothetical protein